MNIPACSAIGLSVAAHCVAMSRGGDAQPMAELWLSKNLTPSSRSFAALIRVTPLPDMQGKRIHCGRNVVTVPGKDPIVA